MTPKKKKPVRKRKTSVLKKKVARTAPNKKRNPDGRIRPGEKKATPLTAKEKKAHQAGMGVKYMTKAAIAARKKKSKVRK